MNKVKIDFIAELLGHKRINLSDKERLFALSLNELKKINDTDDEIRKEIDELRNMIFSNSNNIFTPIIDNPQQPTKFNGIFCGKEITIVADGKTENYLPLCNPSTNEILFELPCVVFYQNDTITGKIIDDGTLDGVDRNVFESLEKKINEAQRRELAKFLNNNSKEVKPNIAPDPKINLLPHNPLYTVAFLKKFKVGDGSGFKELVHDVILSEELIFEILNKVKSHPNFILHYKGEKVSNISFLNKGILFETRKLIDKFEKEGVPFYNETGKHPFNNDKKYTSYAKTFKTKYRYGSGSEYSKLQTDVLNIFNELKLPTKLLRFLPDERKFNIRTSFFTWQPSIYAGIRHIIQGVCDHTNINGSEILNMEDKEITIEAERVLFNDLNFIEIRILDCRSIAKIDSDTLLHFLTESSEYKNDFRNLCDWIVECDFLDESSKRINLLIAPDYSQSYEIIEEIPGTVGGFKNILRFYDVR